MALVYFFAFFRSLLSVIDFDGKAGGGGGGGASNGILWACSIWFSDSMNGDPLPHLEQAKMVSTNK